MDGILRGAGIRRSTAVLALVTVVIINPWHHAAVDLVRLLKNRERVCGAPKAFGGAKPTTSSSETDVLSIQCLLKVLNLSLRAKCSV